MANAYNNLRGLVRDIRNARAASLEGDASAGELIDALCDELDMLLPIGGDDDGGSDGGHDEGVDDPEELVAENAVDVPRGTGYGVPPARREIRCGSSRTGARTAVLTAPAAAPQRKVCVRHGAK